MRLRLIVLLLIAFLVRLFLWIINYFYVELPQSGTDTVNFDSWANDLLISNNISLIEVLSDGVTAFSLMGSLIYATFGRNPSIWGFVLLLMSLLVVFYTYKLSLSVFEDERKALIAGYIVALYPNIAVLSVLTLREVPTHLAIILSFYYFHLFNKDSKVSKLLICIMWAIIGTILHTGILSILLAFIVYIILFNFNISKSLKIFSVFTGFALIFLVNYYGIGLDKFGGSFDNALIAIEGGVSGRESGAVYPSYMFWNGSLNESWKIPLRMIAIVGAPTVPFMVKSSNHLIGVFDSLFYMYLIYKLVKVNFYGQTKVISKFTLVWLCVFTFLFSFSGSNFGTNIRHRAKLLPILAIFAVRIQKEKDERKSFISES